ncbi:MAG: hypothetical protein R2750_01615 [Bacteroidales bacterium]
MIFPGISGRKSGLSLENYQKLSEIQTEKNFSSFRKLERLYLSLVKDIRVILNRKLATGLSMI